MVYPADGVRDGNRNSSSVKKNAQKSIPGTVNRIAFHAVKLIWSARVWINDGPIKKS